jgi:hypothetical protein
LTTRGHFTEVTENLHVKDTRVNGKRCLICYNPGQAKKDKLTKESVVEGLEQEIKALSPSNKKEAEFLLDGLRAGF